MTALEQYHSDWERDAPFDLSRLDEAARNVPILHAKWWKHYTAEKLRYSKAKMDYAKLERLRWEYWLGKLDDQTRTQLGWPVQPLRILQTNVERYLDGDDVLQDSRKKVILCEETLKFLEDVIKHINKRGYDISNSIAFLKFKNGQ